MTYVQNMAKKDLHLMFIRRCNFLFSLVCNLIMSPVMGTILVRQQCPPWTQGLELQEDSRVHVWSEFSSAWATSCGIDLHDVVIGGRQHQDLLHVAVVEHLSRAK